MLRLAALAAALVTVALPVAACSMSWSDDDDGQESAATSGDGGTRRYAIRDFDAIALAGSGDVNVRVGGDWSVTATGTPAALDKLAITRDGDTLKLGRKRGIQWTGTDKVRFAVTMPRITGASIGGAGSIVVDRVAGGDFEGNIGGSGKLDIRGLQVNKTEFSIGGSGNVLAAGRTRSLEINIGGSGDVRAQSLSSETADITIAGAGNVDATASAHADITILGSGNVNVGGGAKCSTTKMGAGRVRCG
ncbi:head GIN domain-containing protein [Sphingomonas rubra]|uniref:Putative auto-transporter adhesin, head GIN domain n=1 Tax=Sphingomonas rubra TaxID=634430 RepID=A0A1I5TX94_9SPHN|nr:head GIN domain-containing protein [Sphingomonas rubra]SFP86936.1 Putative auto-transporter adhesin, head GIN domain [Sphingomonas rubra]